MSKVLLFSDLHVHSHKDRVDRLHDCLDVLNWIFVTARDYDCESILFLGDLFHERAKIDVLNYLRTFEVFMKHMIEDASDKEVYLLVGNHDMYHKERWDVNSIKPLSAVPGVHIVQSPRQIIIGGRKIDWMPHTDNPLKHLADLKRGNSGAGDVLLAHLAVHGAMLNTHYGTRSDVIVEYDNDMVPVDSGSFDDWQMTFLGHYHGAQKLNDKVEYIGSPLQLSFGESFQQKHVIVLDLKTLEKTYVVNNFSPKHLLVTPEDVEHEAYSLDGNFVRIIVNDMGSKELIDLKRKVVKENRVLSLDLKQKDRKTVEEDTTVVEDVRLVLMNTAGMIDRYTEERGVPDGLDATRLREVGKRCLMTGT